MKGLANVGHTCFFNAAVQCLVYAPNSTNYFLQGAEAADVNARRKGASGLAVAFADFARRYWTEGAAGDSVDSSGVYNAFALACRGFPSGTEHDAHEALVCMLDKLHEGLSRMKPGELGVARRPMVCAAAWTTALKNETSVVSEVFRGQVEQRVTNPAASGTSVTYDHFTSLSLAVHDASNLATCLHKFMASETLTDMPAPATLARRFTYLPRVLVVHLKRFDQSGVKIDKFVDYPFELDLGAYVVAEDVEHHYQLFAVCLHRGSSHTGHYAACCEVQGNWFMCDDHAATPLEDINNVIQRDAYMLLYRRL